MCLLIHLCSVLNPGGIWNFYMAHQACIHVAGPRGDTKRLWSVDVSYEMKVTSESVLKLKSFEMAYETYLNMQCNTIEQSLSITALVMVWE